MFCFWEIKGTKDLIRPSGTFPRGEGWFTAQLLDSLVDRGNTVVVIEHNLDVMKQADWIIDVGPDGGTAGGEIVFAGTPTQMAQMGETITAQYLRKAL